MLLLDMILLEKILKDYYSEFIWYRPTSKNVKINPIYNDLIKSIDKIKASRKNNNRLLLNKKAVANNY